MRTPTRILALLVSALVATATAVRVGSNLVTAHSNAHVAWQNMPVIALLNGEYDGTLTVGDAKSHGDLGLGTFAELNGELVELDGTVYQITADGKVHVPTDDVPLSYTLTTQFESDRSIDIPPGTTFATLLSVITPALATKNTFYAIRMTGDFQSVMTRALPRQKMPYPPFCAVQKTQPTFNFPDTKGTMVGFFGPSYIGNVDTAGLHLHFLSENRIGGGHVLSFTATKAHLELDRIDRVEVGFPHDPLFEKISLDAITPCH